MVLPSDYLTVSGTCFINQSSPVMTISKNGIRFSKACHTRLDNCEYVELLYHPILQVMILRKSNCDSSTAMHWRDGNDIHSAFSGRAFGYQGSAVLDESEREADTTSVPMPRGEEFENMPLPDLPEQPVNMQQSSYELDGRGMPT